MGRRDRADGETGWWSIGPAGLDSPSGPDREGQMTAVIDTSAIGNLIFLSYRRADTAAHTLALRLELERQLRAALIFVDTHSIQGGDAWPDYIQGALRICKVVIPVIGKSWAGDSPGGVRRIDDPNDWVYREIDFALANKHDAIVPILVDGAPPPRAEDLPSALVGLGAIQPRTIELNDWDNGVRALVEILGVKFGFVPKRQTVRYPTPDPLVAKTLPVPWDVLEGTVLEHLNQWTIEFSDDPDDLHHTRVELTRTFELGSFDKAVEFIGIAAKHASEVEHHPRLMNIWRTVKVWLSTWDAGHRVTPLDIEFARYLDRRFQNF
jgi:pterin-4a-carbinolamine dehydratase